MKKYYVELISPHNEIITLGWSNIENNGNLIPEPKEILVEVPTKPQVTVNITGDTSKVEIKVK